MKNLHQLLSALLCIALLTGCKKETIITPPGNETSTDTYSNEELADELQGAAFYIIADVEGVPGQAKMFVKSDYYGLDRTAFYLCFGGGYSSYEVDMPRTSGPSSPWVNKMHFSFDSGMVSPSGNLKKLGNFDYALPGDSWTDNVGVSLYTSQYIYSRVVDSPDNFFEVTSESPASDYFKGRFQVTLSTPSGKTVTLKNGVFKIRT